MAGKCEIILSLTTAMLLGDNMLEMKRQAAVALVQPAILTLVLRAPPNQFPQSHFHNDLPAILADAGKLLLGLQLQNRNQILGIHQGFVLVPLIQAKLAVVGSLCQLGDASLHRLRDAQIHHSPSGLRIQTLAKGVQEIVQCCCAHG